MKFVKYLAKGFSESNKNSLVYPDKFAKSKNNVISLVYKLLLELKELYCEDYIHEKDKFDDKSLGEVVQDICVFYSTKDDVGDVIDVIDVIDNSAGFDDGFDDNDKFNFPNLIDPIEPKGDLNGEYYIQGKNKKNNYNICLYRGDGDQDRINESIWN